MEGGPAAEGRLTSGLSVATLVGRRWRSACQGRASAWRASETLRGRAGRASAAVVRHASCGREGGMDATAPTEEPRNGPAGQGAQVHGLVEGQCSLCRQTIAENTLTCPDCGHERQFDQDHYDMLVRCAQGGNASAWHEWRREQPDGAARLEGADLRNAWLPTVDLRGATLRGARLEGSTLLRAALQGADLRSAHLEGADLRKARADGANLSRALLQGADLTGASLEGAILWRSRLDEAHLEQGNLCAADLRRAHLGRARMPGACLAGAKLVRADLHSSDMRRADLSGADVSNADIRGVILREANLNGLVAEAAAVDGGTIIWGCDVDVRTDFTGVGLDSARIDPALRSHLEYNVRRKGWGPAELYVMLSKLN